VPRELRLSRRATDLFDDLRHRDIMLHHPFDAYDGVVGFIQSAAADPRVLSIKQTLYRTSSDSPIFQALVDAAQNQNKEVTVVVELMARFDEASNIRWARNLEDAGVQVFHGILGLKTHCKLALLVRHDEDGVTRRYAHLGTGNYNPTTARFYTDISLLTSDPEITKGAHNVFRYLTAHSESDDYKPLLVSPLTLAETFIRLIHRETEHAAAGRPAQIIAKMNALLEPSVVEALYTASKAGVQIDLIVRGMSALRPGIKGLSENIRVRSIVGRFLEHSRIFYFKNGGDEEIYCGSADWLARNLFERCEVVFPIKDPTLRARLRDEILAAYLADNAKARLEATDGAYYYAKSVEPFKSAPQFDAQSFLIQLAEGTETVNEIPRPLVPAPKPTHRATPAPSPVAVKKARKKPVPIQPQPVPQSAQA
jgi:polyphosphate kinase